MPYPGRTPHIHFAVKTKAKEQFTTQCYIKGHPQNERDGVFRATRDEKLRELIVADFTPLQNSKQASWPRSSTSYWATLPQRKAADVARVCR